MKTAPVGWFTWMRGWKSRRGFVLFVSISVMLVMMISAISSQSVAYRDLQLARRTQLRTHAYLAACSGIEVAAARLKTNPDLTRINNDPPLSVSRESAGDGGRKSDPKRIHGKYSVKILSTKASAYPVLLGHLDGEASIYVIESVGRVPTRGEANYEHRLLAILQINETGSEVLLWSDYSPGSRPRRG